MIVELPYFGDKNKDFADYFKIMSLTQLLVSKAKEVMFCALLGCHYDSDFKAMLTMLTRLLSPTGLKDMQVIQPIVNVRENGDN